MPFRSAFLLTKAAAITLQLKRCPRNEPQGPGFFTQKAVAFRRSGRRSVSRCWWGSPDVSAKIFYCFLIGVSGFLLVFVLKIEIGEETFLIQHFGLMGGKISLHLAKQLVSNVQRREHRQSSQKGEDK